MTGIDSNLEALADKEYQQDEATLSDLEYDIDLMGKQITKLTARRDKYIMRVLEIQNKRRVTNKQQS